MIGISLPLTQLAYIAETLPALYEAGARQIELQYVERDVSRLAPSLRLVREAGFAVMLHVGIPVTEELLQSLVRAIEGMEQESIPLILSADVPLDTDMVDALTDAARENMLPLIPVLECRGKSDLLELMNACGLRNLGICLDLRNGQEEYARALASDKRIKDRLVCVRVEDADALIGTDMREYLSAISYGYLGTYNVSLNFERGISDNAAPERLLEAIQGLYCALPFCARLYDDIQLHFDERFRRALTVWDQPARGTWFSLIHSTSFLFQTNGFRWAMDIAFRNTYRMAQLPHLASVLLKDLELMIISHSHADHFEERTVRRLAENDTRWIIPDFLVETALAWGVRRDRIISAVAGEKIRIGPLTVLPFEGRHFRPVTGKGVRSYGYRVSVQDGPTMVFPGDTRDFSLAGLPSFPEADWCFANVWLGDKSGLSDHYGDILTDYARFMLHFSGKNIIFAHLYECNRKAEDMWRRAHARLITDTMRELSPRTQIHIPASGDVIPLN